jgi:predicted transglutaminase-like cysteine proteinase
MANRIDGKGRRASGFKMAVLAIVALAGVVGFHQAASADGQASFFHSVEFRSMQITPFKKWRSALNRTLREMAQAKNLDCDNSASASCRYREMDAFLDTLRGKSRREQLIAVNKFMNGRSYIPDAENWGKKDYWATPAEFLTRSGDCEDFVIAKFFALKHLGWNADSLRLAAVKDLQRGEGHAVLIAFDGETSWMLDNQIKDVVKTSVVDRYEPVYSINETFWWRHKVAAAS